VIRTVDMRRAKLTSYLGILTARVWAEYSGIAGRRAAKRLGRIFSRTESIVSQEEGQNTFP
jgi:hypothetical protein